MTSSAGGGQGGGHEGGEIAEDHIDSRYCKCATCAPRNKASRERKLEAVRGEDAFSDGSSAVIEYQAHPGKDICHSDGCQKQSLSACFSPQQKETNSVVVQQSFCKETEKTSNDQGRDSRSRSLSFNRLGKAVSPRSWAPGSLKPEQAEEAIRWFRQALEVSVEAECAHQQLQSHFNLARAFFQSNDPRRRGGAGGTGGGVGSCDDGASLPSCSSSSSSSLLSQHRITTHALAALKLNDLVAPHQTLPRHDEAELRHALGVTLMASSSSSSGCETMLEDAERHLRTAVALVDRESEIARAASFEQSLARLYHRMYKEAAAKEEEQ
eukprot:276712-Rhodomonas_salina.1